MILDTMEELIDILDVLLTASIVVRLVPVLRRTHPPLTGSFFFFAMVSLMLTNAYWLAHSLMRPDMRMPLAANTIGECAAFLLLSAAMNALSRSSWLSAKPQVACTVLFSAASVVLWLIWSGEWLQDLLGGVVFGYLMCVCAREIRHTGSFSKKEWIALGITCAAFIGVFSMTTIEHETPEALIGYILMFGWMVYFLYRAFACIRRKEKAGKQVVLSVSSYAFCMSGVYMSTGWWYIAAEVLCQLTLPMMLYAFRKEAEQA